MHGEENTIFEEAPNHRRNDRLKSVQGNPTLRFLAELMLNTHWGKFALQDSKPKLHDIITIPFCLANPTNEAYPLHAV